MAVMPINTDFQGFNLDRAQAAGMRGAQPAIQNVAALQQQEDKAKTAELNLTEQQMGMAFGELLKTGLQGAQAYVEELKTVAPNVAPLAEQSLQSIAPIFSNPNLSQNPQIAQNALQNWYSSVDAKMKLDQDPDFMQKEKIKADEKIRINAAKPKKVNLGEKKVGAAQRDLPILQRQYSALEKKKPQLTDYPEGKKIVDKLQKDLDEKKTELAKAEKKPGAGIVRQIIPGLENRVEMRDRLRGEIKDLELILKDPAASLQLIRGRIKGQTDESRLLSLVEQNIKKANEEHKSRLTKLQDRMETTRRAGMIAPGEPGAISTPGSTAQPSKIDSVANEIAQAKSWLAQNPGHPKAQTVKDTIEKLEAMGAQ